MSGYRAGKSGDAYRTEAKFEQRYDEEEKLGTPAAVMSWIAKVMGSDVPACPGQDWQSIQTYLRDGVILCKFINKLSKFAGLPDAGFKPKATSSFVAMNNIENFNNAARDFGVPQTALFQTADLYEPRKATLLNVMNCLNQLGFVANAKGFNPKFEGIQPPKAAE